MIVQLRHKSGKDKPQILQITEFPPGRATKFADSSLPVTAS